MWKIGMRLRNMFSSPNGKMNYSIDLDSFGYITSQYAGTYFAKYEYTGLDKITRDAVGLQNGNTNLAPPLPQWKH